MSKFCVTLNGMPLKQECWLPVLILMQYCLRCLKITDIQYCTLTLFLAHSDFSTFSFDAIMYCRFFQDWQTSGHKRQEDDHFIPSYVIDLQYNLLSCKMLQNSFSHVSTTFCCHQLQNDYIFFFKLYFLSLNIDNLLYVPL